MASDLDKVPITNPALKTFIGLNDAVMATTDEVYLKNLLEEERAGRARKVFIYRIHSRINKLRAQRERKELQS